jgi:putative flippase GtrA
MLLRNTVVSCTAFAVGLAVLWVCVEILHFGEILALPFSLLTSTTLHYVLGRTWIFRGTERGWADGYVYFLANAGIGMGVTFVFYSALVHWTPVDYITARIVVSLFAGLITFLLNALMNFRQL